MPVRPKTKSARHLTRTTFAANLLIRRRASGLGRACAADLVEHGGSVVILDLNEEQGQSLARELNGKDGRSDKAVFYSVDVSDEESLKAAARRAAEWIAQTRRPLGGVVAAAGVGNPGMVRPASLV